MRYASPKRASAIAFTLLIKSVFGCGATQSQRGLPASFANSLIASTTTCCC